jgi:PKD repeat protein
MPTASCSSLPPRRSRFASTQVECYPSPPDRSWVASLIHPAGRLVKSGPLILQALNRFALPGRFESLTVMLPPTCRFRLSGSISRNPPGTSRLLLIALLCSGCGGGAELLLPGDGEPANIEVEFGDGQNGRVGEPLADSLVFLVTDSRGRPVEGAGVAFELSSAGPGADIVPDTAETDATGRAEATVVLGTTTGPQVGEARVVVPEGTRQPRTSFTVIAVPVNANGIAAISGDDQTGPAGSVLSQPLVVQVTDVFGNPIAGVPITWTAEGGGSVSVASNVTDGDGRASVERTLGPVAGLQSTLAASEGLAGSPVTFIHTATSGTAAGLAIESGDNQTAVAGTELPGDLVVRLVDAGGNGVPGAGVTWVVGAGGGSVSPQNTTTDEAGRASTRWTLGPSPGSNRVDAVVSGVGVVHFNATGTASPPAALSIVVQPSSVARNGVPLARQPVVQVLNAGGTPVATAGITVTAQLSGGGGALLGTRQRVTDPAGRAIFTDLAIAGAIGTRTLVFTASGFAGATSTPISVSAIATTTTITSHSPHPSVVGQAITVGFSVSAAGLVPTGSVTVTDGVQSCSGVLSSGTGSCQLVLTTAGQRTLRASYSGSPGLNPSTHSESHRVDQAQPENRAPVADFSSRCEGLTCAFTDASRDEDGSVVSWSWNFGDGTSTAEREPTHAYPAPGTYSVTLTVTDDDGATDQATAQVQVSAPEPGNQPPVAAFTASCDQLTCRFESDGSDDPDGRIADYSWNFGDGQGSDRRDPSHTYSSSGTYTVTLTVTDNDGASNSVSHQVSVTAPPPPNQPPNAEFAASCTNLSCSFTDQSSDPDGQVVAWSWDFGDGQGSSGPTPSHTYASAGSYTVRLTVRDEDGSTDEVTHSVTVNAPNQPPTAAFNSNCSDLTCSFGDQSSDPDGQVSSWSWDFGDGQTSSDRSPSHTYASGGTYSVALTVTDNQGATGTRTEQVTVSAPNQPPTAAFNPPSCITGQPCQFADASTDSDGTVIQWEWDFDDSGAQSSEQNPTHTYSASGTYDVRLRVRDDDGAQSQEIQLPVTVTDPAT